MHLVHEAVSSIFNLVSILVYILVVGVFLICVIIGMIWKA